MHHFPSSGLSCCVASAFGPTKNPGNKYTFWEIRLAGGLRPPFLRSSLESSLPTRSLCAVGLTRSIAVSTNRTHDEPTLILTQFDRHSRPSLQQLWFLLSSVGCALRPVLHHGPSTLPAPLPTSTSSQLPGSGRHGRIHLQHRAVRACQHLIEEPYR